jgi:hypothetical protein
MSRLELNTLLTFAIFAPHCLKGILKILISDTPTFFAGRKFLLSINGFNVWPV